MSVFVVIIRHQPITVNHPFLPIPPLASAHTINKTENTSSATRYITNLISTYHSNQTIHSAPPKSSCSPTSSQHIIPTILSAPLQGPFAHQPLLNISPKLSFLLLPRPPAHGCCITDVTLPPPIYPNLLILPY